MKKIISFTLFLLLIFSLSVPVTTHAAPAELVGSGLPEATLNYCIGDYEMNIVSGGMTVNYPSAGIYLIAPDDSGYVSKYQIKYPLDEVENKITFSFVLNLEGPPTYATMNIYAKDMVTKHNSFNLLCEGEDSNKWLATDSPMITGTDNVKFIVDMTTGEYFGSVNNIELLEIGSGTNSVEDLSGGIGMVEIEVGMNIGGAGVQVKDCSVSDSSGAILGQGKPEQKLTYTDGYYESEIIPYESNRIYYKANGTAYVQNHNNDRHTSSFRIKSKKYQSDPTQGDKLIFEFDLNATGNPFYPDGSKFNLYSANNSETPILTITDLMWSTGEWKLNGNTPSSLQRQVIKFTVDVSTGDWTMYAGNYQFTGNRGAGTVDTSNGVGMAEFVIRTEYVKGASININAMKMYTVAKTGISDVEFMVGDSEIESSEELESGDTLSAKFNLFNSGAERNAVLIVAVYDGNRTIALKTKTVSLNGESQEEISIDIPDKEEAYTVECYMFDSLSSYNPITSVWSLE